MARLARTRIAVAIAALAALALVAAGCGGSEGGGGDSANARSEFAQSFGPQGIKKLNSGVVDASVKLDVGGDRSGSASLHVGGPFQRNGGSNLAMEASSDLPGANADFKGQVVTTQNDFFLVANGTTYELGQAAYRHLKSITPAGRGSFDQSFERQCTAQMRAQGLDPSICGRFHPDRWLGEVSDEGSADVAGARTQHLQAQVDVQRLVTDIVEIGLQAMPPAARGQANLNAAGIGQRASDYVKDFKIDVYRGDDGIPRRVGLTIGVDAGGSGSADLEVDVTFSQVNQPQTITPPSGPTKPLRDLVAGLPGPFAAPFTALYDCITRASSLQEVQRCSSAVGAGGAGFGASTLH